MDEKGQGGPEEDDAPNDDELWPLPDHHGAQDFGTELEFQGHGHALGQIEAYIGTFFNIPDDAPNPGNNQNDHTDTFKKVTAVFYGGVEEGL